MADPVSISIGAEGYRDFIEKCVENWYIELRTPDDTPLMRVNAADSHVTLTSDPGTSPVTFRVEVEGTDMPSLPAEVGRAALYRVASGGTAIAAGDVAGALLYLSTDRVAVIVPIYVPGV